MGRRLDFFATRQDSLDLLLYLEGRGPLYYALWGTFAAPISPTWRTAADLPDLGIAVLPSKGTGPRYMVFPRPVELTYRTVTRTSGEIVYVADPSANPPCVTFCGGGRFGDGCLIAGTVQTGAVEPEGLKLFGRFERAIRRRFVRVVSPAGEGVVAHAGQVGTGAIELLRAGWRFTESVSAPRSLDFRLPPTEG